MVHGDGGAHASVLLHGGDNAGGSGDHRRTRLGLDIDAVMGPPIPQSGVIGQLVCGKGGHSLPGQGSHHNHRLCRLDGRGVHHGGVVLVEGDALRIKNRAFLRLVRLLLQDGADGGILHDDRGLLDNRTGGFRLGDGHALSGFRLRNGAGNGVLHGFGVILQQGEIANHSGCDHADEQGYVKAHAAEDGGSLPLASVVHNCLPFIIPPP